MHYIRKVPDLETGEVKTISLGEHLTFTEAAAKFLVTRHNLIKVLLHLGLVQKEFDTVARENRYRLHPEAEKKGLGKRLKGTHGSFDVLGPSALEWIEADLKALLAATTFDKTTVIALQALDAFDMERTSKLDVEGKVLWLVFHFPDLPVRQMAHGLGVSESVVHRYLKRRDAQIKRARERMVGEVSVEVVEPEADPDENPHSLAA